MNFSTSDLCKRSAKQLCFLRANPAKRTVTEQQLSGNQAHQNVVKSKFIEMCGCVKHGHESFYFSWDEVQRNKDRGVLKFIEHKMVTGDAPDWYLKQSVLQVALYAALTVKTRYFNTATFFLNSNKDTKKRTLDVNLYSRSFYLKFGSSQYRIRLKNSEALREFLYNKAKASLNYTDAQEFDNEWKHKEFDKLMNYFIYTPVN